MARLAALLVAMTWTAVAAVAPFKVTLLVSNLENGGDGKITLQVHPEWAPNAAERFASMLEQGFFEGMPFYKVISGFSTSIGVSTKTALAAKWEGKPLGHDARVEDNSRGKLSFATDDGHPTEMVLSLKDNDFFDRKGYAPFAEVIDGLFVLDRLTSSYGSKPEPSRIEKEGMAYLKASFPKLSYIQSAEVVQRPAKLERMPGTQDWKGDAGLQSLLIPLGACVGMATLWYIVSLRSADALRVKV